MVKGISAGESAPTLANTQIAIHSNLRDFEKPIERRIALQKANGQSVVAVQMFQTRLVKDDPMSALGQKQAFAVHTR